MVTAHRGLYVLSAVSLLVLNAAAGWGQSLSRSTGSPIGQTGQLPLLECGAVELTHSSSDAVVAMNSASCNILDFHANNSYFRAFDLPSFGIDGAFHVCEVQIGVEVAFGGDPTQPLILNLYTNSGAAFPNGTLNLVASRTFAIQDQALTLLSLPISAQLPAGSQLVVEVFTPSGIADGYIFFIGSNTAPETAPSYLAAASCSIPSPVTTATVSFPDMHIVMNVRGATGVAPAPALGRGALMALVVMLVLFATLRLRARVSRT